MNAKKTGFLWIPNPPQRRYTINRSKIFIADDSPIIRERLVALIGELEGFDVSGVAQTGAAALDEIAELPPDILILDMAMPAGSGFDVLLGLKRRSSVPLVIVLTNYPTYRKRCLQAGADYFFDKSAEFDQFLLLLDRLKPGSNTASQPAA